MAGTVKKLQFSEGTDVGAPTDLSLATSTTVIKAYADDSAFVTGEGAPIDGSVYLNSTTKKFRYYLTDWRNAVPESDAADPTKTFLVDITGNATGVSCTLDFNAAANRVYTFPDATTTMVGTDTTQTLSNKTLSAAILASCLISGGSLDVQSAGALAFGASVGANNLTIGGASSTVIIPGNLTVNGTTTHVNSTNLDVTDKNITVNKGGNDASSVGAGLTVERVSTFGSFVFDASLASKWKLGLLSAEVEVADISTAQNLSNKTILASPQVNADNLRLDGNTLSSTDTNGDVNIAPDGTGVVHSTAPVELDHETTPSNPTSGRLRVYAKNTDKLYTLNSAGVESELGAGGSGELNNIDNPNDAAAGWAASGAGITVATTSTASDLPLQGVIETAIKITPVSGTDYVRYRWTMPAAMKNRKLKLEWHQRPLSGYATGDLKIEVYKNAASNYAGAYTEFGLSTDDSGGTSAIPNQTGKYTTTFDADDGDYFELRFVRVAGTTALNICNVIQGPGIQPQGAVVGRATSFTMGITDASNVSVKSASPVADFATYTRVGEWMHVHFRYVHTSTAGTAGTGTYRLHLPAGHTINAAKVSTAGINFNGSIPGGGIFSTTTATARTGVMEFMVPATSTYVAVALFPDGSNSQEGLSSTSNLNFSKQNIEISGSFAVPINEWADSGTLSVVQDDTLTEWTNFTPTGSWTANTTYSGKYRRNGDTMELVYYLLLSGAPTSTPLTLNMPTGYTIDTTKLGLASQSNSEIFGQVMIRDAGTANFMGVAVYGANNSTIEVRYIDDASGAVAHSAVTQAAPMTFANTDTVLVKASVPVTEWRGKSNGAVGFLMATRDAAGLVSTGTQTIKGLKTLENDDSSAVNGLTLKGTTGTGNGTRLVWEDTWSVDGGRVRGGIVADVPASNEGRIQFYTLNSGTLTRQAGISQRGALDAGVNGNDNFHTFRFGPSTTNSPVLWVYQANTGTSNAGITVTKARNDNSTANAYIQFEHNNTGGTTPGAGGGNGQINGNGANQAAFGSFSDARLKENIQPLVGQLTKIMSLRPAEFDYKAGGHQIGFIAQEMQQVYSDTVSEGADGMLMLTGWDKTSARLVCAIQELKRENDDLRARLEALEARLT